MNRVWNIQLLGRVCASNKSGSERRFQTGKVGALLGTLAHNPTLSHTRDSLIDSIWPDKEIGAARSCLRTALHALREELEPSGVTAGSIVSATHESISLNFDLVSVDVVDFRSALCLAEQAHTMSTGLEVLSNAARLYSGDFLPGYFMDWALLEREQLSVASARVLGLLARHHMELGELEKALELALRAVATNPERESSHQLVMELYGALGQPGDVARQYRTLQRTLRRQLGKSPSTASQDIAREFCAGKDRITQVPKPRLVNKVVRDNQVNPSLSDSTPPRVFVRRSTIPAPVTRFFGREEEVRQLVELVSHSPDSISSYRVISLTGPGGSGKTRLAQEAARQIEAQRDFNVYFVPLVEARSVDDMLERILAVLGVPRTPGQIIVERICQALAGRKCLLILDTVEQLLPEAAWIFDQLHRSLETTWQILTSRRSIEVEGCVNMPVHPLDIPLRPGTPERLMEFASVQLYCDRARRASPGFEVTSRNAAAIASICRLLEGIPLAIELAASRSREHTPLQIIEELRQRLNFLVDRRRLVNSHHKTMEEAIAWSYDLLPKKLQRFFCSLSAFRNGWTAKAAEAACGDEDTMHQLEQLIDRSLVYTDHSCDEVRFKMLDVVREFAQSRCRPSDWKQTETRHTGYFADLAAKAEIYRHSAMRQEWVDRIDREHDNMVAVLEREKGTKIFAEMASSLGTIWYLKGHTKLAFTYLNECAVSSSEHDVLLRARVLHTAGWISMFLHKYADALTLLTHAETLSRNLDDYKLLAEVLTTMGLLCQRLQDFRASEKLFGETLSIARSHQDRWIEAASLSNLGDLLRSAGKLGGAATHLNQSFAIYQELEDSTHAAIVLNNIGVVSEDLGEYFRAKAAYERCLQLAREIRNTPWIAISMGNLGEILGKQGKCAEGLQYVVESTAIRSTLGDRAGVILGLERSSGLLQQLGHYAAAVRTISAAAAIRCLLGSKRTEHQDAMAARVIGACRTALTAGEFESEWAAGEFLNEHDAITMLTTAATSVDVRPEPRVQAAGMKQSVNLNLALSR